MLRLIALLTALAVCSFAGTFTVTPTTDASALVNTLLGSGITIVGTPTLTGVSGQGGSFVDFDSGIWTNPLTNATGDIKFASGVILSSGYSANAAGAYTNGGASSNIGGTGDADLTALAGYTTYDAVDLTFSFTTPDSNVFFNYVFASTEYFTYVNTQYNDAFGFFLDGVNLALVPGTNTPVAVNNVNVGNPVGVGPTNAQYFTQYSIDGATPFNYGGLTQVLTVQQAVTPGSVHTISLKIADASDPVLDSAVLIQGGTFGTINPGVPEPATLLLVGGGLLAAVAVRMRRYRRG